MRGLQLHVNAQCLRQACCEDVDLLFQREEPTGEQGQKLLLVVGHCLGLAEVHQFTKQVMTQGRTKSDMDHVGEASPDRHALVALDVEVPLLCGSHHVIRRGPHLLGRALGAKQLFVAFEPGQRIFLDIKVRKFQAVEPWRPVVRSRRSRRKMGGRQHVLAGVLVAISVDRSLQGRQARIMPIKSDVDCGQLSQDLIELLVLVHGSLVAGTRHGGRSDGGL